MQRPLDRVARSPSASSARRQLSLKPPRAERRRYRTTEPMPVHDNWKGLIRLHVGNSLTTMPVFLPSDGAIPAREIPATARFERAFLPDHEVLQREQKDAAPALTGIAYAVVVAVALALLVLLAWGLHRLGTAISGPPASVERQQPREPAAVAA